MRRRWPGRTLVPLLITVLLAALLFGLCYQYDNKYNTGTPQAKNGVLLLDRQALERNPVIFLVNGWELYSGLHTPETLQENPLLSGREVFIGQYAGFEAVGGQPHGSATLALSIALPPETRDYMLELPEIYSAYELYINGRLMRRMGEVEDFRAETGNSAVTFAAAGRAEIVLAMRDEAHFYSGLTYPPAFGEPQAVMRLLNTRLIIRAGAGVTALFTGLFFLALAAALRRRDRGETDSGLALLFGLICLCFLGYTCYPLVKTLSPGGLGWYVLETFCYSVMLLLVMLLQTRVSGVKGRAVSVFLSFATAVCACTLLTPLISRSGLEAMLAYSRLVSLYFILCALYLTVSALWGIVHEAVSGRIMLCGVAMFDAALVMDRLLPDYEPIRTGWFSEWAGAALLLCSGLVIGRSILAAYRRRAALERNLDGMERMMEAQLAYYPLVLEQAEEARAARHDLRHHLTAIRGFTERGEYPALAAYLEEYGGSVAEPTPVVFCQNRALNMLLSNFAARAREQETVFSAQVRLPHPLPLPDSEMFALVSNLLENAQEASLRLPAHRRWITASLQQVPGSLVILVDNAFNGQIALRGERLLSLKEPGREGIGTAAVRRIAVLHGGSAAFRQGENVFSAEILLPVKEETR